MSGSFLSSVLWAQTVQLAVMRVVAASVIWSAIVLPALIADSGASAALVAPIAVPLFVGGTLVASLIFGILSQWGVPFTGIVSIGLAIITFIGDPLIWLLKKIRPAWVPVDRFGFFNLGFIYVVHDTAGELR